MFSCVNIVLLRQVLQQLHENVVIADHELADLYQYLFYHAMPVPVKLSAELQESAAFLKDIIETEGLNSPEEVITYFELQKKAIGHYIEAMIERVDKEMAASANTPAADCSVSNFNRPLEQLQPCYALDGGDGRMVLQMTLRKRHMLSDTFRATSP